MAFGKGILGGLVGGALGVGLWAGVGYVSGYELGFLAWTVGFFVGIGALAGAGGKGSAGLGIAACVIAVASILAGKLAVATIVVQEMSSSDSRPSDRDRITMVLADEIVDEKEEAGIEIIWPDEGDPDAASTHGYPAAIWKQAAGRFNAMSLEDRQAALERLDADEAVAVGAFTGVVFLLSVFRPMSLVWMGLAIGSAFKIASRREDGVAGEAFASAGGVDDAAVFKPVPGVDDADAAPVVTAGPLAPVPPAAPEDDGLPLMSGRGAELDDAERRAA